MNPAAASSIRRIWLCADDYGIALGVNTAIRDLIARERINATSVIVAAPSFHRPEALSVAMLNIDRKRVAIGLHLTLTAPFRPLSRNFAPLRGGAFLPLGTTFLYGALGRFTPRRLRDEVQAQMNAFIEAFGQPPDFLDGHLHVHLFPQIRDAVLRVAGDAAPAAWVRQCGRINSPDRRWSDPKGLLLDALSREFRRRAQALGIATNPAFAGTYGYRAKADFAALFPRFLAGLPDGGLIMCHPGFVDAELERLDSLTTLREREYAFFAGDEFPTLLARHGVALASHPAA